LVVVLRVLHGMRRDVGELCEQRRALCAHHRELELRCRGLLAALELPPGVRAILGFRRAAIAVLASNRLRRLLKPSAREVRCPARRSALRVRLPSESAVYVTNGLLQRQASDRDSAGPARYICESDVSMPRLPEAANVPSVVGGLLMAVRSAPVLGPASGSPAGALWQQLQHGLHRVLLATVRPSTGRVRGGSPPHNHPAPPTTIPQPGVAAVDVSGHHYRGLGTSPPRLPGGSLETAAGNTMGGGNSSSMLRSALKATPRHHHHPLHSSSILNSLVSPSLVSPGQSSVVHRRSSEARGRRTAAAAAATDVSGQSNSEEFFAQEVLNVIRALDTKVTASLRRPHRALSQ
jgi:hypothetical protein